jgi:hypothetical protein
VDGRADFNTGDEAKRGWKVQLKRLAGSFQGIVIGDGNGFQSDLRRHLNDLSRRVGAVRCGGVEM